ncbi:glycoside hydrolase family 127 protein [Patellaria atrata CBS 101060]|uniref:Glycoside hydrolase family 127 protein n=1 Tax=Patellaria atrata CBS 101060 TaxID=1346257 RepID=A0A9P4S8X9_9PEZI|nr:glycoside hydrolase family 127 protein [Patellaria atrata CBS 101060]
MYYLQVSFTETLINPASFLGRKRQTVLLNTLPFQLRVLKEIGRYDAFRLKWHPTYDESRNIWPGPMHAFWDSDVAKWIEGACYFLHDNSDDEIEHAVDELVDMIRAAQHPDGYLNIYFTVVKPKERFSNLRDMHGLYNAGHLIEAALAHEHLYHNKKLLSPILSYVKFLSKVFGPGEEQRHGYPGHLEIELALLRLYQLSQDSDHLALARYFLTERGNGKASKRDEGPYLRPDHYPNQRAYWYQQAHLSIIEQNTIQGHSVRAIVDGLGLKDSALRIWNNMVDKKMYVTGFGIDYFLPPGIDEGGCSAETCASIGVMLLAERLLQLNLNARYADILELYLYNTVFAGMASDWPSFTYANQLASSDTNPSKRHEWFSCACCPPNITRLLRYITGYLWTTKTNLEGRSATLNCHLYGSTKLRLPFGEHSITVSQNSAWPWEGLVNFKIETPDNVSLTMRLRIPRWARSWKITPEPHASPQSGYITLSSEYLRQNPNFELDIPLEVRQISPHPLSNQHAVALARGPIVYCLEDVDNSWINNHFKGLVFDTNATTSEHTVTDAKTKSKYVIVKANGKHGLLSLEGAGTPGTMTSNTELIGTQVILEFVFIPYYFRGNRGGSGQMRVLLRRK